MLLTPTYTIEDVRQAMFGYRRDEKGEIIAGDLMWDPGSREAKEVMEQARLRMSGYCRNYQGKIVGTWEEAVETGTQRQARVFLDAALGVSASWRHSTGLWTVTCNACDQPLYQEPGTYPQMTLRDQGAAMNAIREHRLACK